MNNSHDLVQYFGQDIPIKRFGNKPKFYIHTQPMLAWSNQGESLRHNIILKVTKMTDLITNYLKKNKQRSTAKSNHSMRLDKSRLPNARTFYKSYGFTLKGSSGWQMVKCPFHDDTHASMGINRTHGGFKCHACGVSGDIIGFYMQYHSVNFKDACRALKIDRGAV